MESSWSNTSPTIQVEKYKDFLSQPAILALKFAGKVNVYFLLSLVYKHIVDLLRDGRNLRFQWIPGHSRIPGNEFAEFYAKNRSVSVGPNS